MKRFLTARLPSIKSAVELDPDESHHAIKVLRVKDGEVVEALDGKGQAMLATIQKVKNTVLLRHAGSKSKIRQSTRWEEIPLVLEVAILKGPAMDWLIEKSVEIGVKKIIPVVTERCVVRTKKDPKKFQIRWQTISDQALKQCGRLSRMVVEPPSELSELKPDVFRLWPHEADREIHSHLTDHLTDFFHEIRVLIGPEGGWDPKDESVLAKFSQTNRVSLGPNTLRAETAAIYSTSVIGEWYRKRLEIDIM